MRQAYLRMENHTGDWGGGGGVTVNGIGTLGRIQKTTPGARLIPQ